MGSWSVYCGVSQIAITAGDDCVLLPLRKADYQNYHYFTHYPATLPIFGEYNDYGGIEEIKKDENTALIEEHFGLTIEEFCWWFTDASYSRYGDDEEIEKIKNSINFKELESLKFMWIRKDVYDFVSQFAVEPGHLQMGKPYLLEHLGFVNTGKSNDSRCNQVWEKDGIRFNSDGEWMRHEATKEGVYTLNDSWSNLSKYITIPEDRLYLTTKDTHQLYELMDDEEKRKALVSVMTGAHYDGYRDLLSKITSQEIKKTVEERVDEWRTFFKNHLTEDREETPEEMETSKNHLRKMFEKQDAEERSIQTKYIREIATFAPLFSDLKSIAGVFHCMSKTFEPYILYLTPQSGAHRAHSRIITKFAEILAKELKQYEEEDEE